MNTKTKKTKKSAPVIVLALSTPSIERTIVANEQHTSSSIVVGFTRFTRKDAHKVWVYISALAMTEKGLTVAETRKALKGVEALQDYVDSKDYSEESMIQAVTQHIREAELRIDGELELVDTRETDRVAVGELVQMYLNHSSFYQPFVEGFIDSLHVLTAPSNTLPEEEVKN